MRLVELVAHLEAAVRHKEAVAVMAELVVLWVVALAHTLMEALVRVALAVLAVAAVAAT
jgi:hypothetical protein